MLDIRLIRENPEMVEKNLRRRNDDSTLRTLHEFIAKDKERLALLKNTEELRRKRNETTRVINEARKKGEDINKLTEEAKSIVALIKKNDERLERLTKESNEMLMRIPNLLHDSVAEGVSDEDNVEIRTVGKKPEFNFAPKSHLEILENLGFIDGKRGSKIAGHGFFYLKGRAAILDYSLQRFALDSLMKRGYIVVEPPLMLQRKPYEGVTDLDDFENVMYKIEDEDLYMIATAEHPLGSMFMNETLIKEDLPIKLVGISPCFRKEVGAHGKYTKGLFRMHTFSKVEQFIFSLPEDSWALHEELQKNCEELYEKLGIYFRVVNVCTGDIGNIAAKKLDTEIWMADGKFREVGSNSNCTDYQARRLGIKWREKEGKAPAGYVHTLNNTAIATSRTMVAIIEQHQQNDGTVKIPTALQKYTGFKKLE